MNTTKTMTDPMHSIDMVTLSLCAARPILRDQVAAVQGTGVSTSVSVGDARLLGGVPSIKSGMAGVAGDVSVRDRAYATSFAPIFADGVSRSAPGRPLV